MSGGFCPNHFSVRIIWQYLPRIAWKLKAAVAAKRGDAARKLVKKIQAFRYRRVCTKMKRFSSLIHQRRSCRGFSLVESVLSLGIMSFGFLALAPLLALGLKSAQVAREDRMTAQIAETMIEEAKQGTLVAPTAYFDAESNPCASAQAAYVVQGSMAPFSAEGVSGSVPLTQLTLRVSPRALPHTVRIYADVFPTPSP
jgi:Tfp pilus assembly protein PilV